MTEQEKIEIAEVLGVKVVLIPAYPGIASAWYEWSLEGEFLYHSKTKDYPDFTSLEWQEKIRDRVRELWDERYNHIINEWYWENSERVFVIKLYGLDTTPKGYKRLKASTESGMWTAALLYLAGEKNEATN